VNCGYSGIFLADLTNNAQKLIAEGTFAEYQWPTVSPDESMLAFQRSLEGGLSVVMVYNIANTQTIETINAYSYYWSPDNTLIIYSPYEDSDEFRSYVIYDPSTNEYSNVLRYNSSTGEIIEGNIQNYY
jgi:Tol biopolymer transport system component